MYRTVRGKKTRLAIAGDLVIKIRDIVIFVESNAGYWCNTKMSKRYIVKMTVVYSQKLHFIVKWKKIHDILNFVKQAPIIWYSKQQNTVEMSTFGREFVMKISVELIEALRYIYSTFVLVSFGPVPVFN